MADVYWAARDLDGPPWGNHQFILIYLDDNESLISTESQSEASQSFVTLGGHIGDGNLVYFPNQSADVRSVREVLDPSTITGWSDYDMEKKYISPPNGGGWGFAVQIEELAQNYLNNSASTPVEYDLWDENCAAWVNTLLKVAGVSKATRMRAGEFSGIDWGEEDLLPVSMFE
jgi:hypothetical protein